MILPGEIQSIAGKKGVRDTQIEKDYVISWVIGGISTIPYLKENLIFKGGTVLKKVYFPDYRFSEDLDFTFSGKDFDIKRITSSFKKLIEWVFDESRIPLTMENETQHDTGNFNFYLTYTGPLGGVGANKDIKVDISQNELICNTPDEKLIINSYSDLEQEKHRILCYLPGEIIAEKMRSLIQRTAPRDLYDLWYLFEIEGQKIEDHIPAYQEKTQYKGYNPTELIRVIEKKKKTFAKHWNDHLAYQMIDIPDFSDVWREMGKHWRKFQKFI